LAIALERGILLVSAGQISRVQLHSLNITETREPAMVPEVIKLGYTVHVFGKTVHRQTAQYTVQHCGGGVGSEVTNHSSSSGMLVTVTTLKT